MRGNEPIEIGRQFRRDVVLHKPVGRGVVFGFHESDFASRREGRSIRAAIQLAYGRTAATLPRVGRCLGIFADRERLNSRPIDDLLHVAVENLSSTISAHLRSFSAQIRASHQSESLPQAHHSNAEAIASGLRPIFFLRVARACERRSSWPEVDHVFGKNTQPGVSQQRWASRTSPLVSRPLVAVRCEPSIKCRY